jgi:hypothetical protein
MRYQFHGFKMANALKFPPLPFENQRMNPVLQNILSAKFVSHEKLAQQTIEAFSSTPELSLQDKQVFMATLEAIGSRNAAVLVTYGMDKDLTNKVNESVMANIFKKAEVPSDGPASQEEQRATARAMKALDSVADDLVVSDSSRRFMTMLGIKPGDEKKSGPAPAK